ncbi:hypothetical protein [Streptomyces sp. NPDC048057]|uniref:hypothetical protein n=1 Tax=Streptomyces sp. NPDC048057 TaxID=3155628 RepID=UPI0033E9036D
MTASAAHLLLSALTHPVPGPGLELGPGSGPEDYPAPLTSEPPLPGPVPLTSEPPLVDIPPLTSEPTAHGVWAGGPGAGV